MENNLKRLRSIYSGMKSRCNYEKNHKYRLYGGRGIKICDEWSISFNSFTEWAMSNGYDEHLTIDRINGNMGYSPDNCRWATYREQNLNLNKQVGKYGFIGVKKTYPNSPRFYFRVRVTESFRYNSKSIYETALDAAIAYNKYCDDNNLQNKRNIL